MVTVQALSWVLAGLSVLVGVAMWSTASVRVRCRNRGEVFLGAATFIRQLSELTDGLNDVTAVAASASARGFLQCPGAGMCDPDGRLLHWDGDLVSHHFLDIAQLLPRVNESDDCVVVSHGKLHCQQYNCQAKYLVVKSLVVDRVCHGYLIVVVSHGQLKRVTAQAEAMAQLMYAQLSLAHTVNIRKRAEIAEIRALRARISPQFLFSSLTTIKSVIRSDPQQARSLLDDFADFTRQSFRGAGLYVSLGDELAQVDRFLALEQAKGRDLLRVQLQVAPEVAGVTIPALTIQPLVENAIKHGIPGGGTITIVATDNGSEVLITVDDDGQGMDAGRLASDLARPSQHGSAVALGNIAQRWVRMFGEKYQVEVETGINAGMRVILRAPKAIPLVGYF